MTAQLTLQIELQLEDFKLNLHETLTFDTVLGVFGPSGSGKTTLLRCLAGLEKTVSGVIYFNGDVWQKSEEHYFKPAHRRGIGYVFQDARLLPNLTVMGNLKFAAKRSCKIGPEFDEGDIVSTLSLAPLLSRMPDTLSGGERQRVAIARALMSRPRLLLMDEPLAATDIQRRTETLSFLRTVIDTYRLPIIYVSHSLDELAAVSDSLLVLYEGERTAFGQAKEIIDGLSSIEASAVEEVDSFIRATLVSHEDDLYLSHLDFGGQFLAVPRFDGSIGDVITLKIDALDVALAIGEPSGLSIRNVLKGNVEKIREIPGEPFVDILVCVGQHQRILARITRLSSLELELMIGCSVWVLIRTVLVVTI